MTSELELAFDIEGALFDVSPHIGSGIHLMISLPNGYQVSCIPEYGFGMGEIVPRPGEMEIAFLVDDGFVRPLPEYDYDDVIRHLTIGKAVELVKQVAALPPLHQPLAPRKDRP